MNLWKISVVFLLVVSMGCSRGRVVEHSTGDFKAVDVELSRFPHTTYPANAWERWYTNQYYTESQTSGWEGYNYGWDYLFNTTCQNTGLVGNASLSVEKWYRFEANNPPPSILSIYEPYITYIYHDIRDESCNTYDCNTNGTVSTSCFSFPDIRLHLKSPPVTYPERFMPDILPDLRELTEARIECAWENSSTPVFVPDAVGLKFDVGIANTGTGQLRIETPLPGDSCSDPYDCPRGLHCSGSGFCEYDSCNNDGDCPGSLECLSGTCGLAACSNSVQCADGPGCIYDGYCPGSYPGSEGEKPCTSDIDCFPTEECLPDGGQNYCFARSCTVNSDCSSNYCWPSEGKCVPQPAACDSNSTHCACDIGTTGTCGAATYQVIVGHGYDRWSYPLPTEFVDTTLGRETPDMLAVSSYFTTPSCRDTDFDDRDQAWLSTCNVSMDTPLVDSACLQTTNSTEEFDSEVYYHWGFTRPTDLCSSTTQNVGAGDKTVIDADEGKSVIVLERRSVNSSFGRLSSLSGQNVYVEAHYNPTALIPLDRTPENNVARAKIQLPTFTGPGSVNWYSFCEDVVECGNDFSTGKCQKYFGGTP